MFFSLFFMFWEFSKPVSAGGLSTGVSQTARVLMSPGLFSVFKPISAMRQSGLFRFSHWFPIPTILSSGSWVCQLLLVLTDLHVPYFFQFSGNVQVFVNYYNYYLHKLAHIYPHEICISSSLFTVFLLSTEVVLHPPFLGH